MKKSNTDSGADAIVSRVGRCIAQQKLLDGVSHLLVGVSGGSDSMAMLHILAALRSQLSVTLAVAHLDHGLRGEGSAKDAVFVADQCKSLGIACICEKADLSARLKCGESIEMRARRLRYAFFARSMAAVGAQAVATGHTAGDQAETVLMRLIRGSALRGVGGIRPRTKRGGICIIRPILTTYHDELRAWLRAGGRTWREDPSNQSPDFQRNRIRNELLPLVTDRISSSAVGNIVRFSGYAREDEACLDKLAESEFEQVGLGSCSTTFPCVLLNKQCRAIQRRWLVKWLDEQQLDADWRSGSVIEALIGLSAEQRDGARWCLSEHIAIVCRNGCLCIEKGGSAPDQPFEQCVRMGERVTIRGRGLQITLSAAEGMIRDSTTTPGQLPAAASLRLPSSEEANLLCVRSPRDGDRIRPMGMRGSRKLQDIFVDLHVPRRSRSQVPILLCGDQIIWVPGYRIATDWALKNDQQAAMHVSFELP